MSKFNFIKIKEQLYSFFPPDENIDSDSPLAKEISDLEISGVKLAESGDAEGALRKFEEAVLLDPQRPSAYNNRAQTLRLFNRIDGKYVNIDR